MTVRPRVRRGSLVFALAIGACDLAGGARLGEVVTVTLEGASNPTVAVSADGVYYVAWVAAAGRGTGMGMGDAEGAWMGVSGPGADVWVARSSDGVVFSEPVRVNDVPGDAAPHEQAPAQVAVGPDGLVVVVWQNNRHEPGRRFPFSDVRLARSVDGGRTFEAAVTVNDDAGGEPSSHTFHDVAIGAAGEVAVSWIDSRERSRLEREAAPPGGKPRHDSHAGHGVPTLPGPEIRVATSQDGGATFMPSRVVAAEACPCCRTSLEAGTDGRLVVAWRGAEPGDVRDIMIARATNGGFAEPQVVHADGWRIDGCPHAGPAIALDDGGRVHVAWYTGAEGKEGLYYAASRSDTEFGEPVALIERGFVPVSQVRMSALPSGEVLLAWENRQDGSISAGIADGKRVRRIGSAGAGTSPAVTGGGIAWLDEGAVRFVAVR